MKLVLEVLNLVFINANGLHDRHTDTTSPPEKMSAQGAAHKETPKETFYRQFQGTVASESPNITKTAWLQDV